MPMWKSFKSDKWDVLAEDPCRNRNISLAPGYPACKQSFSINPLALAPHLALSVSVVYM